MCCGKEGGWCWPRVSTVVPGAEWRACNSNTLLSVGWGVFFRACVLFCLSMKRIIGGLWKILMVLSLSGAIKGAFSFSLFVVMAHTHTAESHMSSQIAFDRSLDNLSSARGLTFWQTVWLNTMNLLHCDLCCNFPSLPIISVKNTWKEQPHINISLDFSLPSLYHSRTDVATHEKLLISNVKICLLIAINHFVLLLISVVRSDCLLSLYSAHNRTKEAAFIYYLFPFWVYSRVK